MSIEVRSYCEEDGLVWDDFSRLAENSTFLHSRLFLSYHGNRFEDQSAMVFRAGKLAGLFPAATHPKEGDTVVSHPGITYGGLVHKGALSGEQHIEAMGKLCAFYFSAGFRRMIVKPVPHIYQQVPSQDDLYALFRLHASRIRCDLSATIDLQSRRKPSSRRIRSLKKAQRLVNLKTSNDHIEDYWDVLSGNLEQKHGATPVHSVEEIKLLVSRFPAEIELRSAALDDSIVAGVLLFKTNTVWHAQYIASDALGYECSALDAVFEEIIQDATAAGIRYFDFGTSNEDAGWKLNEGLYQFKTEFGGGGVAYEQYEVDLSRFQSMSH